MVWIALAVMMCACAAQHLGLSEAVARIVLKVAKCPKCMTFWCVLLALLLFDCGLLTAMVLSLGMAYLSHYFNLLLMALNRLYDKIWQRLNE